MAERAAELPAMLAEAWALRLEGGLDERRAGELAAWLDRHPDELAALRREAALDLALTYALAPPDARLRDAVIARLRGGADPGTGRFAARVMTRVRRRPRPARGAPWAWIAAAASAAALVAIVVLTPHATQPSPAPTSTMASEPPRPVRPTPPPAGATVIARRGQVHLDAATLTADRAVALPDRSAIGVGADGAAEVRAADGSVLSLDGESLLANVRDGAWRLERGALAVDAAPQAPGRHLTIATPCGEVSVIGTRFRVEADAARTWVGVERGRVALASASERRELSPGQEAVVDADGVSPMDGARRRVLAVADGEPARAFDPVAFGAVPGTYHGLPLARFDYRESSHHGRSDFADVGWTVAPRDDERRVEVWFRAERVAPKAGVAGTTIALMAALDGADYVLAEREIAPDERGWVRLAGELGRGTLNWSRDQPAPALTRGAIRGVSVRAYRGFITGVVTAPVMMP